MHFGIYYLLAILASNMAFNYLPMVSTPFGSIPPATVLVGAVFVLRDYAQREVGHGVLAFMLVGVVLSYLLASPALAIASAAAFLVSEGVDWLIYNWTKKPFHQRVLFSSLVSVPVDSLVFLVLLDLNSWPAFLLMVGSKMLAGIIVWVVHTYPEAPGGLPRPVFTTYTGHSIHSMLEVRPSDIKIEDIAHALSHQCRFAGHCSEFYSVAQHSVLVAENCPPRLRLQALLHDWAEAYVIDLPRPIKDLLPSYRDLEGVVHRAIALRFEIPEQIDPLIKVMDDRALVTEIADLTGIANAFYHLGAPFGEKIIPLGPKQAKELFLRKFKEYRSIQDEGRSHA